MTTQGTCWEWQTTHWQHTDNTHWNPVVINLCRHCLDDPLATHPLLVILATPHTHWQYTSRGTKQHTPPASSVLNVYGQCVVNVLSVCCQQSVLPTLGCESEQHHQWHPDGVRQIGLDTIPRCLPRCPAMPPAMPHDASHDAALMTHASPDVVRLSLSLSLRDWVLDLRLHGSACVCVYSVSVSVSWLVTVSLWVCESVSLCLCVS